MASLRKRKYKTGTIVWVIEYYEGKTHRMKTIGECDKRTAENIFHHFLVSREKEKFGIKEIKKITLKNFSTTYFKNAENIKAKRTIVREKQVFKPFLEFFNNIFISEITIENIQDYRNHRLELVKQETVNLEFRHLKAIFNWAKTLDYIGINVFAKIKPIRVPESKHPRFFEVNEIDKVRKSFMGAPFENIVEFYILTGARLKEALILSWDNVDFKRDIVTIQSIDTKNKKHRIISFKNDIKLKQLLISLPKRNDNLLFGPKENQNQWSQWWVSRKIANNLTKIGFDWATCHSFRHTYISHLVMAGVPLPTVQKIIGHGSFITTLKYSHLAPSHKEDMISKRPY